MGHKNGVNQMVLSRSPSAAGASLQPADVSDDAGLGWVNTYFPVKISMAILSQLE